MFCKKCGSQIDDDSRFCQVCGNIVTDEVKTITDIKNNREEVKTAESRDHEAESTWTTINGSSYSKPEMSSKADIYSNGKTTKNNGSKKRIILIIALIAVISIICAVLNAGKSDEKSKKGRGRLNGSSGSATTEHHTSGTTTEQYTTATTTEQHTGTTTAQQTTTTTEHTESTTEATQTKISTTTIMVYMVGSDLESISGMASNDIKEMIDAKPTDNVNIIVEAGGTTKWQNNYGVFEDKKVVRARIDSKGVTKIESRGKKCMLDASELEDFVTYASKNYPADRYILIMWDHGGGVPLGFGVDENYPSKDSMPCFDMCNALIKSGVHFQTIIFDACLMASLENAICMMQSADYLVASENYIPGTGTYYTGWINSIGGMASSDVSYLKMICDDYLISTKDKKTITISCIDLSKIYDVYIAYEEYIKELSNTVVNNKNYAGYAYIRNHCTSFDDTDSVDIVSLANAYPNGKSDALIAAVRAASYYKTKYNYLNGLTAYSPSRKNIWFYPEGRKMLSNIGYSSEIIDFYDSFASIIFAGNMELDASGHSWYKKDYVSSVKIPNIDASQIQLTKNSENKDVFYIPPALTSVADYHTYNVYLEKDGIQLELGRDIVPDKYIDSEGNILIDKPMWLYNTATDGPINYYVIVFYSDQSGYYQFGLIPAMVNDRQAFLLYYMDDDNPDGYIWGYKYSDGFDTDFLVEHLDNYREIKGSDIVDFVNIGKDSAGNHAVPQGKPQKASEVSLAYKVVDKENEGFELSVLYSVHDIFGNEFNSPRLVY